MTTRPMREALTPPSCSARSVVEVDGHLGQGFRHSLNGRRVDAIEEAMPNAGQVDRPCRLQFGHTPRSQPGYVPPCVGGTGRLRHEANRLEVVHQPGHPARRQVGGIGQVRHPQLAIGSLGKDHDRRVLARRQTGAPDQVAVEMSRDDFDNPHHCAPQSFLGR